MRVLFPLATPILAVAATRAAAQAPNPWLEERVLNIAHQGGEDEFPSNTLYAFKRSVAAGDRRPPRNYERSDFRVPTLGEVLKAFPDTPITIEIKGRTRAEEDAEYVENAEVLARLLRKAGRRDVIVTSFRQKAVDRFHELAPAIGTAPGIDGVMTARPTAFEKLLRSHDIPGACA